MAREVGISKGSVPSIIRDHIGMRKVAAPLVPHHLTLNQIEHCLEITTDLLSRFTEKGNDFLGL